MLHNINLYAVFRHNDNIRHCLSWFNLRIENLYIENPPKIHFDGIFCENKGHYFGGVLCSSFSCSLLSSTMSFRKGLVLWAKLKKRKSTYTVISSDILNTSWFKSRSKVVHIHLTVKCSFYGHSNEEQCRAYSGHSMLTQMTQSPESLKCPDRCGVCTQRYNYS